MCHSTAVIPFRLTFQPGVSLHEQVVYAATKAIVSGQMRPGDAFPSVRALSKDLKINPNTAHKVIAHLLNDGLLEVRPGIGTVIAPTVPTSTAADRSQLLRHDLEQLVVDAKKLGLDLGHVTKALADHWALLDSSRRDSRRKA
jgi:GntR family transcriptional regulator